MTLHALDLRTGRQRELLNDATGGILLPGDRLLYVRRDGTALVVPFDLDKLAVTGPGVPVLEGVTVFNGVANLTVSRTGVLVYQQGPPPANEVQPARVSREGVISPIDTRLARAVQLARRVPRRPADCGGCRARVRQAGYLDQAARPGAFTRLTFGGTNRRPAWSPDGRTVAFIHDTGATSRCISGRWTAARRSVCSRGWTGRSRRSLGRPTDAGSCSGPTTAQAGAGDIVGVRTSGDTTPVPLVADQFTELHPTISPDGRWIAYTSDESGTQEVYVRAFPGTTAGRWQVSNGGGFQPRWSSDGRELYFGSGNRLMAAQLRTTQGFEVTELEPVLSGAAFPADQFHQVYDVLPGGKGLVFPRPWGADPALGAPTVVEAENWLADVQARTRR